MGKLRETYNLKEQKRLRSIEVLIKEAIINVLAEQEAQADPGNQAQQAQQPAQQPPPQQPASDQSTEQAPQQPDEPPQETTPNQYTVDDMIQELNAIRGGHSFTDPEVYGRLVTFFKNLSDDQRNSLDNLLTQIAELVTGADDEHEEQQQSEQDAAAPQPQQEPPPEAGAPQQAAPEPGAQPPQQ